MHVSYNGVEMELGDILKAERTAIWTPDGQDLLYVRWNLSLLCTYSPGGFPNGVEVLELNPETRDSTSEPPVEIFDPSLRGVDPPVRGVNQRTDIGPPHTTIDPLSEAIPAFLTDAELRSRLWSPRRQLRIYAYDQEGQPKNWLWSPRVGQPCDVSGGPKVLGVDVVPMGEGLTFGVHFTVQTDLPPCPDMSDRIILGHRWEMSHVSDENHYLTRVITGDIVFNLGILGRINVRPDMFRDQFFHPIPLGMRRGGPEITQSADGSVIHYVIRDRDTEIIFDPAVSGATNIDIVEEVQYSRPLNFEYSRPLNFELRGNQ